MLEQWNLKKCPHCGLIKPLDSFHNNKSRRDGKNNWCKTCMKPALKKQRQRKNHQKQQQRVQNSIKHWNNLPGEIWKDIKGYEGSYQISNKARIKSTAKGLGIWKLKKTPVNKTTGYPYVGLSIKGRNKTYYLHVLMATAFIDNPNNYKVVNHINGNKTDCSLDNLQWCSQNQNVAHAIHTLHKHNSLYRQRTPKNLSSSHRKAIKQIYNKARQKTKETGIKYSVDHIHPLYGKTSWGLHVPWNLQIILLKDNQRKNNKN